MERRDEIHHAVYVESHTNRRREKVEGIWRDAEEGFAIEGKRDEMDLPDSVGQRRGYRAAVQDCRVCGALQFKFSCCVMGCWWWAGQGVAYEVVGFRSSASPRLSASCDVSVGRSRCSGSAGTRERVQAPGRAVSGWWEKGRVGARAATKGCRRRGGSGPALWRAVQVEGQTRY